MARVHTPPLPIPSYKDMITKFLISIEVPKCTAQIVQSVVDERREYGLGTSGRNKKSLEKRLRKILKELVKEDSLEKISIGATNYYVAKPLKSDQLQMAILECFVENKLKPLINTSLYSLTAPLLKLQMTPAQLLAPGGLYSLASYDEKEKWLTTFQESLGAYGLTLEDLNVLIKQSTHFDVAACRIGSFANLLVNKGLLVMFEGRYKKA